ncbi:MAG: S41 family peptidase [Pseudomonadota bacterium]
MRYISILFVLVVFILSGCSDGQMPSAAKDESKPNVEAPNGGDQPAEVPAVDQKPTDQPAAKPSDKKPEEQGVVSGLTLNQRVADAGALIAIFDHQYAPKEWKQAFFKQDFKLQADKLIDEVSVEKMDDEDFFAAMAEFVNSFKDGHTRLMIPSTYQVSLGFAVDRFGDEVLIVDIDDRILDKEKFPFKIGDRLVAIDGVDVSKLQEELSKYVNSGSDLQRRRLAASSLVSREQASIPDLPGGVANVTIFSRERSAEETVSLKWIEDGYELAKVASAGTLKNVKAMGSMQYEKKSSLLERIRGGRFVEHKEYPFYGRRIPIFPMWDSFVKRGEEPIYSGVFTIGDRKIGFIRFDTWMVDDNKEFLNKVEEELKYFQENTDALLIDQMYNGGGDPCLATSVVSMLIEKDAKEVLAMARSNRTWLMQYEGAVSQCDAEKNGDECKMAENIIAEIRGSIEKGSTLAGPFPFCNADGNIKPASVYSKSIVMLINEMSISVGDDFPVTLQDAGRAVLFGETTAGGGGSVNGRRGLGYSDFSFSFTDSLSWRDKEVKAPNGEMTHYIENVGAIPDVHYPENANDYLNGYKDYKAAVEKVLMDLIQNNG